MQTSSSASSRRLRYLSWGAQAGLLTMALVQLAITVSTLLASTLQHPFQDEFRLMMHYLLVPFPQSVMDLQNGHRPVFPGIVRHLELMWFGGSPSLQVATAWGAAILVTAMLFWDAVRTLPRILAGVAVCLIFSLLWWNANARMFIHPFEAVGLFFLVGGLMAAVWCMDQAAHGKRSILLWIAALFACVFATFSFGPGIGTFLALFVLAILRRERVAVLVAIAGVALVTVVLYIWGLPGAEGVRNSAPHFEPVATLSFLMARIGAPLHEVLTRSSIADPARLVLTMAVGAFVLVTGAMSLFSDWRKNCRFSRLASSGIGLFVFGVTANVLIVANRTDYFVAYPDQLFADRYLFWSCLVWLGAGLYALTKPGLATSWRPFAIAALSVTASLGAMESARWYSGWSAEAYRRVELGTAGLALGLRDESAVKVIADDDLAATYRAVDVLRATGSAGYGNFFGRVPLVTNSSSIPVVKFKREFDAGVISGVLPNEIAGPLRITVLWIVSADGTLAGRAAMTASSAGPRTNLRLGVPTLDRFEGYLLPGVAQAKWLVHGAGEKLVIVAELLDHTP